MCIRDRDFLELFLWQAERHADILVTILARMSARMSMSAPLNASLTTKMARYIPVTSTSVSTVAPHGDYLRGVVKARHLVINVRNNRHAVQRPSSPIIRQSTRLCVGRTGSQLGSVYKVVGKGWALGDSRSGSKGRGRGTTPHPP